MITVVVHHKDPTINPVRLQYPGKRLEVSTDSGRFIMFTVDGFNEHAAEYTLDTVVVDGFVRAETANIEIVIGED